MLVGDNPHKMPLIQILHDEANPSEFITVGYDRSLVHWQVMPGGSFIEPLGTLLTLGSTVNYMAINDQFVLAS
jgi:hypothetical protein